MSKSNDNKECEICYEVTTNFRRKKIECNNCNSVCCLICFKTYLLSTDINKCIGCNKKINIDFIYNIIPLSFHKKYRDHLFNSIYIKEKQLLPYTQDILDEQRFIINKEHSHKKLISKKQELLFSLNSLGKEEKDHSSAKFGNKFLEIIHKLKKINNEIDINNKKKYIKNTILKQCPDNNCKGYLSNEWICKVCNMEVCKDCEIIIREESKEHICDKEILLNIKNIKENSKRCPMCYINISKINGCDQMWCPKCHTAFSWETGKIEKGKIHNPHYYEWQRDINNGNAPRVFGDNTNNIEMPTRVELMATIYQSFEYESAYEYNYLQNLFICILNIYNIFIQHLNEKIIDIQDDIYILLGENEQSELDRIYYLTNRISEDQWKRKIKKNIKNNHKERLLARICIHFMTNIKKILHDFVINNKNVHEIIVKIQEERKNFNLKFKKIHLMFGKIVKIDIINDNFQIYEEDNIFIR